MPDDTASDVVHLQAGEHLPATLAPSPTTEMLKQLLEQMLENERRRLRNEYVRISMLFSIFLAVAIGGGLWFAHSLLGQLRAERQTADRSLQALLQHINPETYPAPGTLAAVAQPATALRGDTNTVQTQADIKRIIADLESKKKELGKMLKSQDAQTKSLLQNRDDELQVLHARMQEMQRKIMNMDQATAAPLKATPEPPAEKSGGADSLSITTSNAVKLRIPIPAS